MPQRLDGKVALVTGGASGIGRAASLAYARDGARVVVADVDATGGEETPQMIKAAGGEAALVYADVSKTVEVQAMVNKTVELYGRLDCAFNNAGVAGRDSDLTADYSEEDWDRVIGINLKGVWLSMKAEIPFMLQQGGGAIVNTASVAGFKSAVTKQINEMRGTPGQPLWQRNYYEHVIRNDRDLDRVRQYILENPGRWAEDPDNPGNIKSPPG